MDIMIKLRKFVPVAVSYEDADLMPPVTYVLWRCERTGQVYSQTIEGHWTMADITGQNRMQLRKRMHIENTP